MRVEGWRVAAASPGVSGLGLRFSSGGGCNSNVEIRDSGFVIRDAGIGDRDSDSGGRVTAAMCIASLTPSCSSAWLKV